MVGDEKKEAGVKDDKKVEFDLSAPMEFNLERLEVPVTLKDMTTGQSKKYMLREMDGRERDAYLNTNIDRVKIDGKSGKAIGMRSFDGIQSSLLSKCLFEMPGYKAVPSDVIQTWKATIVQSLFDRAMKMNGLEKEAEEDSKKE